MRQSWGHLLFLHWAWDPVEIQRTLPPGLRVDVHDGRAWIGVVPFFMQRVRPRGLPAVPFFSDFLELNVRTYVHDAEGRPGVWFYSLDCNRWLAVKVARTLFHLPYEHAAMSATIDPATGEVDFRATRRAGPVESATRFVYRGPPAHERHEAQPGSLEFFLVERYRLFAWDAPQGRLLTGRVHHAPYQIGAAVVPVWDDTMLDLAGLKGAGGAPDHVVSSNAADVAVWPLEPVAAGQAVNRDAGEALGPAVVPA